MKKSKDLQEPRTEGEFVIEADVPIPDKKWSPPRETRFPFRKLLPGESFLISTEYVEKNFTSMRQGEQRIRGMAGNFSRTNGVNLSVRKTRGGFRVYRLR